MATDREHELDARNALMKHYGVLYDDVAAALFEADPIGISSEKNTDEYEPEVETILPRLEHAHSAQDVVTLVHEAFCHWFGPENAGSPQKYLSVSLKIWGLWLEFKQAHGAFKKPTPRN